MLFSWQRRKDDPQGHEVIPEFLKPFSLSTLDWSEFVSSVGWPSIKIWLTSEQLDLLDGLAAYRDQSQSEVIRDLLFIAIYGHYAYAQLVAQYRGFPKEPGPIPFEQGVLYDIVAPHKDKQKSPKKTENVRLFVPAQMKNRLEQLAFKYSLTLSETANALLVRMAVGESFE